MRRLFFVAGLVLLSACASEPETTACTEPRPQVCTMVYDPSCAVMFKGQLKTYSSSCNACADDAVSGYTPGPCPE